MPNPSSLAKSFVLLFLLLGQIFASIVQAANHHSYAELDSKLASIMQRFVLHEGWELAFRAPGSLSSIKSFELSRVYKRYIAEQNLSQDSAVKHQITRLKPDQLSKLAEKYGAETAASFVSWQHTLRGAKGLSDREKLQRVNRFFNKLAFKSDMENWGKQDYWASPLELLATQGGDCEDFAIAKYFSLRALGIDADRMRITYVKSKTLGEAHMVLAYYEDPAQAPLILDNLNTRILTAMEREDLVPVFGFNG